MKLTLKNFRCYKEKTFEFDDGLTLISGPSGVGKSTILMAIHFAIFGTGLKVSTVGTNSCIVELEMKDIKIIRRKRPNHLIVNDKYEDDAGQSIINKKFGDTFNTTGYIDQNARNSFIMMSPIEKLGFLETFAFKDVNLKELKMKCKEQISKAYDELKDKTNKLEITKNIVSELTRPEKFTLDFIDKYKNEKNKDITIKNEHTKYKKLQAIITDTQTKLDNLKYELHELELLLVNVETRKELINNLNDKLKDVKSEYNTYENHEDKTEYYQEMIDYIIKNRKIQQLKDNIETNTQKLSEMKLMEIKNKKDKIKNIQDELWLEYKDEQEVNEQIENLKNCIKDIQRVESLREKIEDYSEDIDITRYQSKLTDINNNIETNKELIQTISSEKVYTCPCCSSNLQLNNDILIKTDKIPNNEYDIESLTSELNNLQIKKDDTEHIINIYNNNYKFQKKIDEILNEWSLDNDITSDSLHNDVSYLRQYIKEQYKLEKMIQKMQSELENEDFSQSYTSFEDDLDKMKRKLEKLKDRINNDINITIKEDKLYELLQHERNIKHKYETLGCEMEDIQKQINKNENIVSDIEHKHIEKYNRVISREYLSKQIEEKTTESIKLNDRKQYQENRLSDIDKWLENRKQLQEYDKWLEKIKDMENDEIEYRKRYAASTQLKDKIIESESIAITNVIHSINTHANVYLETFFSDTPISVQLQPFKETKKQLKPSINITVEYKGMEIDLNMLSGGEVSRVILAYTLALSEIFNTPLLMLDECTASLDEELTNDVFLSIKEHFSEKNTLIIAHQVVTGTFDNMIIL